MSSLDMEHTQFSNTPEDKFKYQWTLIQYMECTHIKNQQKKDQTKNFNDILDQANQSIDANKS